MRIGLVLGAGGSVGVAFHGAVLATLESCTGWDPRTADLVVGTSAGSISGASLRAGFPATDLVRISEGGPLSAEGSRLAAAGRPHRPRPAATDLLSIRPVADPGGVVHALTHPFTHSPGGLLAALLPAGGVSTAAISSGIDAVFGNEWPRARLWLCAVDLHTGARVVFGRQGAPDAPVGDAVAASCAIPAYFKPVVIGGRRYVDGGVWSPLNLDLAGRARLDLIVVSSPMSSRGVSIRGAFHARLASEAAALRRRGVEVMTIEPDRDVVAAMGLNPMDAARRSVVSRSTRACVEAWLATDPAGRSLAGLLGGAGAPGSSSAGSRGRRNGASPLGGAG